MKKLVVFASGSGSNFQAIIDAVENGTISAEIAGLISNKKEAGAVGRAQKHQIPVRIIPAEDPGFFVKELPRQLDIWSPDLIVLAGFLKKIPDKILKKYPRRIINIHPSLLPKYGGKGFYGQRVHQAVLDAGDDISGCTVHYVNEEYDRGDIIRQERVDVLPGDTPETLAARVLSREHQILPVVIKDLINPEN